MIKRFWEEYEAYALRKFETYYYDRHPLEDAVIRIVAEQRKHAKHELLQAIKDKMFETIMESSNGNNSNKHNEDGFIILKADLEEIEKSIGETK